MYKFEISREMIQYFWGNVCKKITTVFVTIAAIVYFFGGFSPVVTYWDNYQATKKLGFSDNEYGVLVCYFDGEDEYKNYVSKTIYNILSARFRALNMKNASVQHDAYLFSTKSIDSPQDAESLGKKYNADLVIWGSVNDKTIQPNIRIVGQSQHFKNYPDKDITIFKRTLLNIEHDRSFTNIRYPERRPELTDEAFALISFVIAKKYMNENKFETAIKYFYNAIPIEKTSVIRTEPAYINIAICNFRLGKFSEAEKVILRHTNFRNNEYLEAFIGQIRIIIDSIHGIDSRKLADLFINASPHDWRFIDEMYLLSMSTDQTDRQATRKVDKVDEYLEQQIKKGRNTSDVWNLFSLQYYLKEKDYESFKRIYKELFKRDDLDLKLFLTLQSLSVDTELTDDSIKSIRAQYGNFASLALIEAFKCAVDRDVEGCIKIINANEELRTHSLISKFLLASYYSDRSDYKEALSYLDNIIVERPNITVFRKLRGDIYAYTGNTEKAIEDLEVYLKKNQNDTKRLYKLSKLYALQKDTRNQVRVIKQLLEQPVDVDITFSEITEAIFNEQITFKSFSFPDERVVGIIRDGFEHVNSNDSDLALKYFQEQIQNVVSSDNSDKIVSLYYYCLALIEIIDFKITECQFFLLQSYVTYPTENVRNLMLFASDILASFGVDESEGKILGKVSSPFTDKESVLFYAVLNGLASDIKGHPENTAKILEDTVKEFPRLCILNLKAALYRFISHNRTLTVEDNLAALKCNDSMKHAHALYADLMLEVDCPAAIQHFLRSLEVDGESYITYDGLSRCYKKIGEFELAKIYYKKYKKLYFEKGGDPYQFFFYQPVRDL